MKGTAFKKPQVTKRQRKNLRPNNEAMYHSFENGQTMTIAGTQYIGANPIYANANAGNPNLQPVWVKVRRGVPFVKVRRGVPFVRV